MLKEQTKFAFELNKVVEKLYNAVAEDLEVIADDAPACIESMPKTFAIFNQLESLSYQLLKEKLCFDDVFCNSLCSDISFDEFWEMWGRVLENAKKYN